MAKHLLTLESDYDYDLIGICCHHSDYRLCWSLNEALNLNLKKADEDFAVSNKKGLTVSRHSFYEYLDEVENTEYYLIKNKSEGKYLMPEKQQIDYFLVIRENVSVDIDDLVTQMKTISTILTAVIFDPEELKSADKLIF